MTHSIHHSKPSDPFKVPEPVFAEWGYYNIDYRHLACISLDEPCLCCQSVSGTQQSSTPPVCVSCDDMSFACRRELEKVSTFLHMKGNELEHNIRACEHYVQSMASLELGEQLVGLGQTEETVGAAMSHILALARFRRSNFTALWRQLDRLQTHCPWHYGEMLDHLALSPLFTESSLESQQLFRASQIYFAIQSSYAAPVAQTDTYQWHQQDQQHQQQQKQQQQQHSQGSFPGLHILRGWIDHACVGKVHSLLNSRLSTSCNNPGAKSPSTVVGSSEHGQMDPGKFTPPMSQRIHKSSSSSTSSSLLSNSSLSNTIRAQSKRVFTVYLDNPKTLQKYHSGLTAEASTRDLVSLSWLADDKDQNIYISNGSFIGPWFAGGYTSSTAMLKPDQALPFLHGEFNLNKLEPPEAPPPQLLLPDMRKYQMDGMQYSSKPSENDAECRAMRRDQLRKAQKIQKKIIMESLSPLMLVAEERIVYTDPNDPESITVVLRRNVSFRYKENMADHTFQDDGARNSSWLANVIDGNPLPHTEDEGLIGDLPFDIIEIHLDNKPMPAWLSQLFFDGTMARPVLDFDAYIHGIATLRTRSVSDLPYWMVDYSRGSLGNPPDHSIVDMSATLSPEQQPAMPCSCETTHLLHRQSTSARRERTMSYSRQANNSNRMRSCMSITLLIAVTLSIPFAIWPHHKQVINILFEVSDLVAQWIARLLDFR